MSSTGSFSPRLLSARALRSFCSSLTPPTAAGSGGCPAAVAAAAPAITSCFLRSRLLACLLLPADAGRAVPCGTCGAPAAQGAPAGCCAASCGLDAAAATAAPPPMALAAACALLALKASTAAALCPAAATVAAPSTTAWLAPRHAARCRWWYACSRSPWPLLETTQAAHKGEGGLGKLEARPGSAGRWQAAHTAAHVEAQLGRLPPSPRPPARHVPDLPLGMPILFAAVRS